MYKRLQRKERSMSYRSESHSPVCRQAEDRRGRIIIEKEREGFGVNAFAN